LEHLTASGIWCVTRADDAYPARLRNALKHNGPAVLFGAGEMTILQKATLAVVGSRNLDRLVLVTPYRPDHGFSVGAAMGLNKIIYGASDYAVVVSSDYKKAERGPEQPKL
jgi:predicted Rossmann fold nucleotide-binding protein DprA/Smf involved in DNA uptake